MARATERRENPRCQFARAYERVTGRPADRVPVGDVLTTVYASLPDAEFAALTATPDTGDMETDDPVIAKWYRELYGDGDAT
jgi:hypothetical protein